MIEIVEKSIPLRIPLEDNCRILLAQIPNVLRHPRFLYQVADPEQKWAMVRPILEAVAEEEGGLDGAKFVVFPEVSIPFGYKDEIVRFIESRFPLNTVVILGFEHILFNQYCDLLSEYRAFNAEAHTLVSRDRRVIEDERPVNCCLIVIKDDSGQLHCYVEAKTHPFIGEEFLDQPHDLYRGRHLHLFRSSLSALNFMVLICLDYIYRDRQNSNAIAIIRKANELFYKERQQLDLLFVIETYGHSSVVFHQDRRFLPTAVAEYSTGDLTGGPVLRFRFGQETRLYVLELSLFYSRDPRTTRNPLEILNIFC